MNGNMFMLLVLLALISGVSAIPVRLINQAIFIPISALDFTIVHHRSNDECLCLAIQYLTAMNFFSNGSCQIFVTIPCAYEVRLQTQVKLYLLDQSVSLAPQSCTANLTRLINTLNNTVPKDLNVMKPRCLVIDNHGYLVTVLNMQSLLVRYNSINLTLMDQTALTASYPLTIAFHDDAYYIASYFGDITVINSNTLATNNMISSPYINKPRDIIFINNGYTMIIASSGNNFLLFFDRSNATSTQYIYTYRIPFSHSSPHGLWLVNDSFFYVTSYDNNTIFSYVLMNNTTWIGNLVVDARDRVSTEGGTHVTVDPHGRLWFSVENGGILIYDNQGVFLECFSYSSLSVYDLLITENYTIYLSSYSSDRIVRLNPNIVE